MKSSILLLIIGLQLAVVLCQPTKLHEKHGYVVSTSARRLAYGTNHFGLKLYDVLKEEDANVFFSPFSVSNALGMLHLGARRDTARELANALGYTKAGLKDDDVFRAFQEVLTLYETGNDDYTLDIANKALTGEKLTFPILYWYKEAVKKYYHAEIERVNFKEDGEEVLERINAWVNEKTHGKIEKLLEEPLNEFTVLVLLNAVYFKGSWLSEFDPKETKEDDFRNYDGSGSRVPLMAMSARFNHTYSEELNSQVLELPYVGNDLSMYVVLPQEEDFTLEALEKRITVDLLEDALENLRERKVVLKLPRFKLEEQYNKFNDVLRKVGVRKALNGEADFSGITGHLDLFVSKTVHKAVIEVNEEGSEAAAVTGVVVESRNLEIPEEFICNRPFLFFIRDNRTGLNLFVGSVKHL